VIWNDSRDYNYDPRCPGLTCPPHFVHRSETTRGYNLANATEFVLPFRIYDGVFDGDLAIVFEDSPLGDRISVVDLWSQEQVASWLVPRDASSLAISGDVIVWVDNREAPRLSLYGYDLRSQTEFLVAKTINASHPAIYDDFVVWEDGRHGPSSYGVIYGERISNDER
jgi:hypothetical protein